MAEGNPQATADKTQIARAAGLVMALFIVSRALGLLREMIISHQFGTSGSLDAYLAAFRLPNLLFEIVAGGALASAFVPTFATCLARGDERGAWRLASAIINIVLLVTAALAVLALVLAPWLVHWVIAPGFDPAQQALATRLMRLMLLTPAVWGVSGVVMGILNARQHFLLPALAPILYNLGIIGGALFLAPRMGVGGLAVGVVVGALGHLLVQVPGLVRGGMRYAPTFDLRNPNVGEVGRLMLPRMVGIAAVQLNFLVNTTLASGLATGSLAALNYAWLLMLLPEGVFAQAVATAAFPTFSAQAARGEWPEMRSTLVATLRAVLYLSIPAAVGLIVLRTLLVGLLLQRGAFTESSTYLVATALAFYALGLPAHSVVEIAVRAFYAMHDTKTPVTIGVAAMGLNIALSLAFIALFRAMGWLPFAGLALSNTLATTVEMTVLIAVLGRRLRGLEGRRLAISVAKVCLSAAVMGVVAGMSDRFLAESSIWLAGVVAFLAGIASYVGVSLALRASEPRAVWQLVRSGRQAPADRPATSSPNT